MSRIGRKPISLPKGVEIDINKTNVSVKGAKGSLKQIVHPDMLFDLDEGTLSVRRPTDSREHRSLHGLTRSLISNMVVGVSEGFTKRLVVEGVGYRAEMDGRVLVLNVGYSHPVRMEPPADVQFEVTDRSKSILVSGIDKQVVGEISAQIRKVRPPEPYKGKGIRYADEVVRRKAGKTGKV